MEISLHIAAQRPRLSCNGEGDTWGYEGFLIVERLTDASVHKRREYTEIFLYRDLDDRGLLAQGIGDTDFS